MYCYITHCSAPRECVYIKSYISYNKKLHEILEVRLILHKFF